VGVARLSNVQSLLADGGKGGGGVDTGEEEGVVGVD